MNKPIGGGDPSDNDYRALVERLHTISNMLISVDEALEICRELLKQGVDLPTALVIMYSNVIRGPAPPPSYDEVMRQPEIYPQVHRSQKSSEANI